MVSWPLPAGRAFLRRLGKSSRASGYNDVKERRIERRNMLLARSQRASQSLGKGKQRDLLHDEGERDRP